MITKHNLLSIAFSAPLLIALGVLLDGIPTANAQPDELTPICKTPTASGDPKCWLKVDNHDNCYVWITPSTEQTAIWLGQCQGGKSHGPGELIRKWGGEYAGKAIHTGQYVDGIKHGMWEEWYGDGSAVSAGPYVDGKRDGRWVFRNWVGSDGDGSQYLDGESDEWREPKFLGGAFHLTGSFMDGKRHGRWISRNWNDGSDVSLYGIQEYVNDKQHGWDISVWPADSTRWCQEFANGVEVGDTNKDC